MASVSCLFCGAKLSVPTSDDNDAFIQRHIRCDCAEVKFDGLPVERCRDADQFHQELTSSQKPFHCDECGKDFTQSWSLKNHRSSVHNGEKLLQCEVCGKLFNRSLGLKYHMIVVHQIGEFQLGCEYCNKRFFSTGEKKKHQKKKRCF